jgi:hypothetical protein
VFGYIPPTRLWVDLLRMRQDMAGTQVDTTANGPETQKPDAFWALFVVGLSRR